MESKKTLTFETILEKNVAQMHHPENLA